MMNTEGKTFAPRFNRLDYINRIYFVFMQRNNTNLLSCLEIYVLNFNSIYVELTQPENTVYSYLVPPSIVRAKFKTFFPISFRSIFTC